MFTHSNWQRASVKGNKVSQTRPKSEKPWPVRLVRSEDRRTLRIEFDNADTFELSAEYLRVFSPSAEVQGHAPSERKTVGKKRNVRIADIQRVGCYAVRLVFDDAHQTGIYSWSYLHELGANFNTNWANYEAELAEKGLSRD